VSGWEGESPQEGALGCRKGGGCPFLMGFREKE